MKETDPIVSCLLHFRLSKGLSRYSIAALCNVSESTIYRIENGQTDPTLSFIRNYLAALDMTADDVYIYLLMHHHTTDKDVALMSQRLPPKARKIFVNYLYEMTEYLGEIMNK